METETKIDFGFTKEEIELLERIAEEKDCPHEHGAFHEHCHLGEYLAEVPAEGGYVRAYRLHSIARKVLEAMDRGKP